MATLKRVTPSNPLTNFSNVRPYGGGSFALMAEVANTAFERFDPAAREEAQRRGTEAGRDAARSNQPSFGLATYRDAIASIESAGSGGYAAIGPTDDELGRALGRYQIMEANVGPWSREALGREVSADEFLANPGIQDQIFDHVFGNYLRQYGEEGAAQAWFAGPGGVGAMGRQDALGTSVAEYTQRFSNAVRMSAMNNTEVVRTSSGELKRLAVSPMAGPYQRIHDAAANVAYEAEILNQGAADIMQMSMGFEFDPEGFTRAADNYIASIVNAAPEHMRSDLEASLANEARRRALGIMSERQEDIRKRANNSSRALAERHATTYAEALAAGDADAAAAAFAELDSVLTAREALPGVGWTAEQSENFILDAQRQSERIRVGAERERNAEIGDAMSTMRTAWQNGQPAADAGLLESEAFMAHPDYAKTMAFKEIYDTSPDFFRLPPAMQQEAIERERERPIGESFETEYLDAMEEIHAETVRQLKADPVAYAAQHFDNKPLDLPGLEDIDGMRKALSERREYGNTMFAQGYTDSPAYFTVAERDMWGSVFADSAPVESKAAAAQLFVEEFGTDAGRAIAEVTDNPLLRQVGAVVAAGANSAIAQEALTGQQLINEGVVTLPPKAETLAPIVQFNDALPDSPAIRGSILRTAKAIYAARAQGLDPESDEAEALMGEAFQAALGQTTVGDTTYGGVQDVLGTDTLLTPDLNAQEVEAAIALATVPRRFRTDARGNTLREDEPARWDLWVEASASNSVPFWNGAPITSEQVDYLQLEPVTNVYGDVVKGRYRLAISVNGTVTDVLDLHGSIFEFDPEIMVEGSRNVRQ